MRTPVAAGYLRVAYAASPPALRPPPADYALTLILVGVRHKHTKMHFTYRNAPPPDWLEPSSSMRAGGGGAPQTPGRGLQASQDGGAGHHNGGSPERLAAPAVLPPGDAEEAADRDSPALCTPIKGRQLEGAFTV
jgi:hypothetical protein